jgi:cellulose synthase operon protein C
LPPEVAAQIEREGIGEFMIAGPLLERKLRLERHGMEPTCPEGAAVVWAAIDWQRVGMLRPIPRPALRELYEHYLTVDEPSDANFEQGSSWARRPVTSSAALLTPEDGAYSPHDYIVAYASCRVRDRCPWECRSSRMVKAASPCAVHSERRHAELP